MPVKDRDLHGNTPDSSSVALLIIDMINDLEFSGGEKLRKLSLPLAKKISALKQICKEEKIPAVYINDNFGKWRSDIHAIVSHCIDDDTRGKEIVELLRPDPEDYFVVKPKHSAFYKTTLDLLLEHLQAKRLIITGIASNMCVLFTAGDAYMRDFELIIPSDCIASQSKKEHSLALALMKNSLRADTTPSGKIDRKFLRKLKKQA